MPITQQQIQQAQAHQRAAAHDPSTQVRLIAGPGTGKSFAIGERVLWLMQRAIPPDRIYVISFTRAASLDLRRRVHQYCQKRGFANADQVSVSTLHSMALRTLSVANLLSYPARPLVMDDWELKNIFDAEFSQASGYASRSRTGYTLGRCKEIRRDYEAFCGTGQWVPPNFIPPDPPISGAERADYQRFHGTRTQVYSCVLPGEIVRQCVQSMTAGILSPVTLLGVEHLVVDEYQDLNPVDLQFIDLLICHGVTVFVTGDDDQSIYSFRFASPQGIQTFTKRYQNAADHELQDCFRCTSSVVETASALLQAFPEPSRIPKHLASLYDAASPPEAGVVHRWGFPSAITEARAIAESCDGLIMSGLPPRKIMILLSNTRAQLSILAQAFEAENVEYESPRAESFIDTRPGRFILSLLRIVCDPNDYVAHRLLVGSRPNIGSGICNGIAEAVIANNLNFRDILYYSIPQGVFRGRQLTALGSAQPICARISSWQPTETLAQRSSDIFDIVLNVFSLAAAQKWNAHVAHLPQDITLEELRDYWWADTDEHKETLLEALYQRLGIAAPSAGLLPQRVRIMTMHGAKGLDASVVFIPGLVEEILPGNRRQPYAGLVLEAARMLYVSITRARAACILSYAQTQVVYGRFSSQTPSRFTPYLAGKFEQRQGGLNSMEIAEILQSHSNL